VQAGAEEVCVQREAGMRLTTILDAMEKATDDIELLTTDELVADIFVGKRTRQRDAFRDRILAMDAEKEALIRYNYETRDIAHQNGVATIAAKDQRIAELRGQNQCYREEIEELRLRIAELEAMRMLAESSSTIANDLLAVRDKRIAELEERIKSWEDLQGF
jgi:predicted RNase H-like nuclease (RuvC/YqgF family)